MTDDPTEIARRIAQTYAMPPAIFGRCDPESSWFVRMYQKGYIPRPDALRIAREMSDEADRALDGGAA